MLVFLLRESSGALSVAVTQHSRDRHVRGRLFLLWTRLRCFFCFYQADLGDVFQSSDGNRHDGQLHVHHALADEQPISKHIARAGGAGLSTDVQPIVVQTGA